MRRESYFWGFFLVLLGGLLLLDNLGVLPRQVSVWSLFIPLVLIAMGLRGVLAALGSRSTRSEAVDLPLEDTRSADLSLHHGGGELRVGPGDGVGALLRGTFDGGVVQDVRRSADRATIDLRVPTAGFEWMGATRGIYWDMALNPQVDWTITMEGGASRNVFNLRDLRVKELRISSGASGTEIVFPERAGLTRAWIKTGAAGVDIRVPEGVAARIRATGGLSGTDIDTTRFPQSGSVYQSPDFDTAENRVDIDVETGVGSVKVR